MPFRLCCSSLLCCFRLFVLSAVFSGLVSTITCGPSCRRRSLHVLRWMSCRLSSCPPSAFGPLVGDGVGHPVCRGCHALRPIDPSTHVVPRASTDLPALLVAPLVALLAALVVALLSALNFAWSHFWPHFFFRNFSANIFFETIVSKSCSANVIFLEDSFGRSFSKKNTKVLFPKVSLRMFSSEALYPGISPPIFFRNYCFQILCKCFLRRNCSENIVSVVSAILSWCRLSCRPSSRSCCRLSCVSALVGSGSVPSCVGCLVARVLSAVLSAVLCRPWCLRIVCNVSCRLSCRQWCRPSCVGALVGSVSVASCVGCLVGRGFGHLVSAPCPLRLVSAVVSPVFPGHLSVVMSALLSRLVSVVLSAVFSGLLLFRPSFLSAVSQKPASEGLDPNLTDMADH